VVTPQAPEVVEEPTAASLAAELASLRDDNASLRNELESTRAILANLRTRYHQLVEELHLLKHRLTIAKAERREDIAQAQLAFDKTFTEVQLLEKTLGLVGGNGQPADPNAPKKRRERTGPPPTGRRDIKLANLPVVRVELVDPELEGKAERIGTDSTSRVGYERGGFRHIVLERAVYRAPEGERPEPPQGADGGRATPPSVDMETAGTTLVPEQAPFQTRTAPMPREIMRRGMLAPSLIARLLTMKYVLGVPFYRYEKQCAREGFPIDRGTMCRYAEHVGATLGGIVEAARCEANTTAFCLSTDATGVAIQPERLDDGRRQPCRKGHFFVTLADKDHVFLDFQAEHTSLTVWKMFKGFRGYVQADAHVIYDALFKGIPPPGADELPGEVGPPPREVGCFSHARRKFWEAALCKHPLGAEGLVLADAIFAAERPLRSLAPAQRKAARDESVRPRVDAFFAWVHDALSKPRERGLVATALGYARNHEAALRRFLEDGRLVMHNNASERELRTIATGRKAWLFYGSDDHAAAAGNILSLVASCRLHGLDPEAYLSDVIRILPAWPRDRYLELAPKYWAATRARLDPEQLKLPLGPISVPPRLSPPPAEQEPSSR